MSLMRFLAGSGVSAPAATDPYFSNVVLLLHMDGSNGGTTFTDSSSLGHTMSINGTVTTSTTQKKFGTTSRLSTSAGDLLYCTDATYFNLNPGDFTVEGWFYPTSIPALKEWFDIDSNGLNIRCDNTGVLTVVNDGGVRITTAALISANNWYHIALSHTGTTTLLFVNGVRQGSSVAWATTGTTTGQVHIGGYNVGTTETFFGYIDDLRITKGIARYTNNFTVPSAAFPNAGNAPYATWNPSDKGAGITLSGGNLIATCVASNTSCRATLGKSSGKWYWEVVSTSNQAGIGVSKSTDVTSTWVGGGTNSYGWYGADGKLYNNGSGLTPANGTYTTNTLGFALDMDNGTLYCYLDNVLQPKIITGLSGTYYPGVGNNTAFSATANFGQNPLTYTPPNGTFWNPKDGDFVDYAFSNNNMVATKTGSTTNGNLRSNTSKSAGKLYFEVSNATSADNLLVGIETLAEINYPGSSNGYSYYATTGNRFANGAQLAYGATFTAGDLIGVAIDFANGKIFFSKNGTWQNSGDPVAGTGYAATGISGTYYIGIGRGTTGGIAVSTLNTGATPFAYTPPSGYSAWDATVYNAGVY